ncbi:MAG: ATP-grasp domain-containing protein [Patescibacteria group bacterium]
MKLIIINNGHNPKCEEYLLAAAAKRDLETEVTSTGKGTFEISAGKNLKKTLLYRVAIDHPEAILERIYLSRGAISFFEGTDFSKRVTDKLLRYDDLQKAGVPIPKTIFSNSTSAKNLRQVVRKLGLPLIIKTVSGSCGRGTLIADSFFALKSTVQLLVDKKIEFIFQKFVHQAAGKHVRAIVVGQEIICSYQKSISKKIDFRSNAAGGFSKNKLIALDPRNKKIVLAATKAIETTFGGVDLLPAGKGNYLVSEVNSPCNFVRGQQLSGIDIAGKMLDFLISKAQKIK